MIEHFRIWNIWRKHNLNSRWHKFLVLLWPSISPTYAFARMERENERHEQKTGEKTV